MADNIIKLSKSLNAVKKFYFLDYFYVLLKSVEKVSQKDKIFEAFKNLKEAFRLGESKYKKLTLGKENLTKEQIHRYFYTFEQVIHEARQYKLIKANKKNVNLTQLGEELLYIYDQKGQTIFNQKIFTYMEKRYKAFFYLLKIFYTSNKLLSGLLIFPMYSPRQLGFERTLIKSSGHIVEYSHELCLRLEADIKKYLGIEKNLKEENLFILKKLYDAALISHDYNEQFQQNKYNVIIKRFRDYWYSYFLRNLYEYQGSLSSFDIWTYRGKQIGINHATEFYPNLSGRIVYPISVISERIASEDFKEIFEYENGEILYLHEPKIDKNNDKFVDVIVNAYFDLKNYNHSYFINLMAIRELVCYKLKISEKIFEQSLNTIYKLNLQEKLRIRISLEVDKLPEETKAMYVKQEPVLVDGKYKNIIAIDLTKGKK